ncbi:MAG: HAD family hydrolase [Dehalococcoidia bacterium]|nr:HAD family hydrolase [Dehalococcoidia bacterium]
MPLPRALLLDLDDTILDAHRNPDEAWIGVCREFAARVGAPSPEALHTAVLQSRDWFWADAERSRRGRLAMEGTRREIVRLALGRLDLPYSPAAEAMADRFTELRHKAIKLFPDATDTLQRLKDSGVRLGLLTNGNSAYQRGKIARFGLEPFFDHIQIEEEFGVGKPDERAFRNALSLLDAEPKDAWMVGDNLEADILGAQQVGIHAIWMDADRAGLPDGTGVRPDRIIGSLSELLS